MSIETNYKGENMLISTSIFDSFEEAKSKANDFEASGYTAVVFEGKCGTSVAYILCVYMN